jgi:hypothetical protein
MELAGGGDLGGDALADLPYGAAIEATLDNPGQKFDSQHQSR